MQQTRMGTFSYLVSLIVLAVVLGVMSLPSSASDLSSAGNSISKRGAHHAVGFSGGAIVGTGLTYRMYRAQSFLQFSFLGRYSHYDSSIDTLGGVSLGRTLNQLRVPQALPPTALVLFGGIDGIATGANARAVDSQRSFRTGVGLALEIGNTFSPGLLFSIGTSYALAMEKKSGIWEWDLGPLANFGLLYNW